MRKYRVAIQMVILAFICVIFTRWCYKFWERILPEAFTSLAQAIDDRNPVVRVVTTVGCTTALIGIVVMLIQAFRQVGSDVKLSLSKNSED